MKYLLTCCVIEAIVGVGGLLLGLALGWSVLVR